MTTLLTCDGIRVGDSQIPPFTISKTEHVGLALPADYRIEWNDLSRSLAGISPMPQIRVAARSSLIIPGEIQGTEQSTILDILTARGVPPRAAETAVAAFGLESDDLYFSLQWTPRLVLELRIARELNVELVIFSSGGLDPLGLRAANAEIAKLLPQGAVIDLFTTNLIQHYESEFSFTKVIRCELLEKA